MDTQDGWSEAQRSAEVELVRRVNRGEPEAIRVLMDRYHGLLRWTAARLLPRARPESHEELCQEVWTSILLSLARWQPTHPVRRWLSRVAVNCMVSYLRGLESRVTASLDDPDGPAASVADPRRSPLEEAEYSALRQAVWDCLAEIPNTRLRLVLVLDLEGHKGPEIAAKLGIAGRSVAVYRKRGQQAIRPCLEKKLSSPSQPEGEERCTATRLVNS
jgi:RNA polymerase sigma factor (sigma-70 family)